MCSPSLSIEVIKMLEHNLSVRAEIDGLLKVVWQAHGVHLRTSSACDQPR